MTGADVKRQVTRVVVFYRDDDGMQRYVEYPPTCVVLTAEEAEQVARAVNSTTGGANPNIGDALALLTPDQEGSDE